MLMSATIRGSLMQAGEILDPAEFADGDASLEEAMPCKIREFPRTRGTFC